MGAQARQRIPAFFTKFGIGIIFVTAIHALHTTCPWDGSGSCFLSS
jgi:hypothetical protein